MYLLVSN